MNNDLLLVKDILKLYNDSPNEDSKLICQYFRKVEDKELKKYLDNAITTSDQRYEDIINTIIILENLIQPSRKTIFEVCDIFEQLCDESLKNTLKQIINKYY